MGIFEMIEQLRMHVLINRLDDILIVSSLVSSITLYEETSYFGSFGQLRLVLSSYEIISTEHIIPIIELIRGQFSSYLQYSSRTLITLSDTRPSA
jgi:hypothetical protein